MLNQIRVPLRFLSSWILLLAMSTLTSAQLGSAQSKPFATVDFGIYQDCPVLQNETTRVVLCPQVGGRILEYSLEGTNALFVSQYEMTGTESDIGRKGPSAGRFDIGPEKIVPSRQESFFGEWTAESTGKRSLRMTSQRGSKTGVVLIRDFELDRSTSRLVCKQTITNVSGETHQYCHWSRTFANGAGITLIPLEGFPRFPNRYVRYDGGGLQMAPKDDAIRIRDGFLEITGPPSSPKLGMDSYAGWLAHQQASGLLFIKQFPTYPNRNYCELAGLTISTWTPTTAHTIELEPIGPSETLGPGESASFTETWSLHKNEFPAPNVPVDLAKIRAIHDALPKDVLEGPQP